MELVGKITKFEINPLNRAHSITFEVEDGNAVRDSVLSLMSSQRLLTMSVSKFRRHRSLDANAFLWKCLGDLATALMMDKWDLYLQELKKYGKFTYLIVKPAAVDALMRQWRECEEYGRVMVNGTEAVQMICYFGSSTYDSDEFSTLINGVIEDMKEVGIAPPPSRDMQRIIERMKEHEEHSTEK